METTHLPKVSKILSSKPVAESTAFQAVARFLEKEQKRLDPVAIQKATHLNDVYLVCESLAKADHEKDQLERLRNSSAIQVEKHTKRFHSSHNIIVEPSQVADEEQEQHHPVLLDESPVTAEHVPSMQADADAPRSEPTATVKQEIVADEQPSAMQLTTHDNNTNNDTKRKLKVEKKAKKVKKKKRHNKNE